MVKMLDVNNSDLKDRLGTKKAANQKGLKPKRPFTKKAKRKKGYMVY